MARGRLVTSPGRGGRASVLGVLGVLGALLVLLAASAASGQAPADAGGVGGVPRNAGEALDAGSAEPNEELAEFDAGADAPPDAPAPAGEAGGAPAPGNAVDAGVGGAAERPELSVLPPLLPEHLGNPVVTDAPVAEPPPVPVRERPRVVVKTILGLVALLALAYVGGHPRVQAWERALGISQLITAGFPFVALGLVARLPAVGILDEYVLADLGPVLRVGLGWIGFIVGFRFDTRLFESFPKGLASLSGVRSLVAMLTLVAAAGGALIALTPSRDAPLRDPVFLRDALLLGTAGALTSLSTPELLAARGGRPESVTLVGRVLRLQQLVGVAGLLFVAAYFRPAHAAWQLPGTAWLLLTVGLGATMGIVAYAILMRRTTSSAESIVLILGTVAFAAGMASNLRLSPLVVCFVAGLLLTNFPGHYRERLGETLTRLERPIYLLFLLVVGAIWRVSDWRGWALMVVFVAARFLGTSLGTRAASRVSGVALDPEARQALVVAPMGALSIAVVVGAQVLYPGGAVANIVTAVVGGAIVTEVVVQLSTRNARRPSPAPEPSAPPRGDEAPAGSEEPPAAPPAEGAGAGSEKA